jgi:hypothetical protein
MKDSKGIVILEHKKEKREFSMTHAKSLIALQVKRGLSHWTLPKDSTYEIKNDELIKRASKGTNKASDK